MRGFPSSHQDLGDFCYQAISQACAVSSPFCGMMSVIEIFDQLGSGVPVTCSQNLNCFIDWTGGVS
jgi:hypothetical protein